jgi:hypothetical protein
MMMCRRFADDFLMSKPVENRRHPGVLPLVTP